MPEPELKTAPQSLQSLGTELIRLGTALRMGCTPITKGTGIYVLLQAAINEAKEQPDRSAKGYYVTNDQLYHVNEIQGRIKFNISFPL